MFVAFVSVFAFAGLQLFRNTTMLFAAALAILLVQNSVEVACGTGAVCCVSAASAKTTAVNNNNNKARVLVRAAQDQARHRVHPRNTDIYQSRSRRLQRRRGRILQETTKITTAAAAAAVETKTNCSLCAGIDLIPDQVPPDLDGLLEASLYDHSFSESITTAFGSSNSNDTTTITHTITISNTSTCAEIDLYFQHTNNYCSFGTSNSSSEEALQKFLFKYCCQAFIPVYQCEKNIHDHILNDDYDTAIPPVVRRDTPISVGVRLVYLFLESIEEEKGSASVVFNITMEWNDPRLMWEVNSDTCTDFTTVHVGRDVQTTSIWIPSFNLLNRIQGIEALPPNKAVINSKGNITLNFDGKMKAFCNYKGLANIPYDTLGCQFLFGITERSHDYNVYYLDPDVVEFASFGLEAAYNEWQPIPELTSKAKLPKTPVVYYNMYFKRAKGHYVSNIIVSGVGLDWIGLER